MVLEDARSNPDLHALRLRGTLDVTMLAALDAANEAQLRAGGFHPHLEAAVVTMAYGATLRTLNNILGCAVARLVTHLVALETHLLGAIEGVVRVFTAQDACGLLCLVGALASHMTKLAAVVAFHSDVGISPVATTAQLLHSIKQVLFVCIRRVFALFFIVSFWSSLVLLRLTLFLFTSVIFIATHEVRFTTDKHVGVEARRNG